MINWASSPPGVIRLNTPILNAHAITPSGELYKQQTWLFSMLTMRQGMFQAVVIF